MLQFLLPFFLFSSVSTAQLPYFLNCGSSTNITTKYGQPFVCEYPDGISLSSLKSKAIENTSISADKPYQTARIFNKPSSYNFDIPIIGTYYVRLHFYAFSSSLANANFNVSAANHMLLPNFKPTTDSPIFKEFIIEIKQTGWFKIYFVPNPSSIAFVNAIEVLQASPLNIAEDSPPYITPSGNKTLKYYKQWNVFKTKYRINVGGDKVNSSSPTKWMTWMPDDRYFINKGEATNNKSSTSVPSGNDAPEQVYATAKTNKRSTSNLTWKFSVNYSTNYFVRVYFCDIVSNSPGPYRFNLSIYRNFSITIDLTYRDPATPFYNDSIVTSANLDYINISIEPIDGGPAFLNGLEILQVMETIVDDPKVDSHDYNLKIIISSVASAVVVILVSLGAVVVCLHQKKKKRRAAEAFEWGNLPLHGAASSHYRTSGSTSSQGTTFQNLQLGLKIPFGAIQRVTNNFDVNLIIGEGGFGKVYKGTLESGFKVAVKRGSSDHGQGISEFQTEIMILSKIRHRHLVSLFGYCCENGEMILVYEFMEKGTLRSHLYASENRSSSSTNAPLSWIKRLEICIGAAKGIQYLHTGTNKGIIHRDVKSTNILLDEHYVAKVADFGLSRSGHLEQTQVSISDVKGTLGYLDPEYITCLQLTEKSDVYSFGVVLLEVLCARPVINLSLPSEQVGLNDWAMTCYEEGKLETIIDPSIADGINHNSLMKFWETAEGCLKKDASERPPMADVCWGLEYALQLQKVATERVMVDDSTTDVSLNMTLPAVQRFPSQSIVDSEYNDELLYSNTGEVFSQLTSDNGSAR